MIHTLRKRFILMNMLFVSITLCIVFSVLCYREYERSINEIYGTLEREIFMDFTQNDKPLSIGKQPERKNNNLMPIIYVYEEEQGLVIDTRGFPIDQEDIQQAVQLANQGEKLQGRLSSMHLFYRKLETAQGWKYVFVSSTQMEDTLQNLVTSSIGLVSLALFAFFMMSVYLSRWIVKPVEKAWRTQKQFVADASHELKTPLTVILANIQILLAHPKENIRQQKKWIENTQMEAKRMKELVDDMLFLAKMDADKVEKQHSEVNMSETVWMCVLPFESIAFEKGIHLEQDIQPDLYVIGDQGQLKQLCMIFIDNACKYTKGDVKVSLHQQGTSLLLEIQNDSEVLDKDTIEHIFERFYRIDKARERKEGGYGLGLSIAKSIVKLHQGDIHVVSNSQVGVKFQIKLPIVFKKL